MANRKSGGGFKGIASTFVAVVVIGAIAFTWAKANNINSVDDFFGKVRSTSDNIQECSKGEVKWDCDLGIGGGGTGGKNPKVPETSGGKTTKELQKETAEAKKAVSGLTPGKDTSTEKYERASWKHWTGGRCDNTREVALKRDAASFKLDKDNCKVVSGVWNDVYTGQKLTLPKQVQIDHIVPLNYANKYGGSKFDPKTKEKFANDLDNILAVDGPENMAKKDKGPSEWLVPKNKAYVCTYASKFTNIVSKYGLKIPAADIRALDQALSKC